MSASRIGLEVGCERVRAVLLRGDTLVWRDEERVDAEQPIDVAIVVLLARAPSRRFARQHILAAIGPSAAQVKRLPALPTADTRILSEVVRTNTQRFFLHDGVPLRSTAVHARNGSWWGAVFEQPTLDAVATGCRQAHRRLDGCVPLIALLHNAYGIGRVRWYDGMTFADVTIDASGYAHVRRAQLLSVDHSQSDSSTTAPLVAPLAMLTDGDGHRYAGAYAAARAGRHADFLMRSTPPERSAHWRGSAGRTLLALAAAGALIATLAPGLLAARHRARAERALRTMAHTIAPVAQANADLRHGTNILAEIADFSERRRSMLHLLGSVSQTLPDSTAITSLRVDSVGGTLVLFAPSGPAVVPSLARVDALENVQIIGTITRETMGDTELQRLTLRFRHARKRTTPETR